MSEPTKFCKDCKWFWLERRNFISGTCHHGSAVRSADSVSGLYWDASIQRSGYSSNDCGPDAKYWEPHK